MGKETGIGIGYLRDVFAIRAGLPGNMFLAVKLQSETMDDNLTSWWYMTAATLSVTRGQGIFIIQEIDSSYGLRVLKMESAAFLTGKISFGTTTVPGREAVLTGNVVVFSAEEMAKGCFVDLSIHDSVAQRERILKLLR